jgi:RING finger family protein
VPELARGRGAHVPHVPLFRRFPRTVPDDTLKLYVERVLTHWLATPEQPCLFCGRVDNVWILDPCGHLVCGSCWDQTDYSACPICHRRIDPDSPFLRPSPPREADPFARVLTRLDLGLDVEAAAERVAQRLLARATVLSRADRDDLVALLAAGFPRRLPERIAVKETMAVVIGLGLRSGAVAFADAREHLRTATDVLRALFVWMGAPEDLTAPPKPMPSLPRPLRRFILETLESFPAENLVQDLRRHSGLWKRVGEKLHPFEFMTRYPNTASAFAVIRRTRADEKLAMAAAGPVTVTWERVRARTWGTLIEEALVTGELEIALRLAAQRPGELARRFDHLLRRALAERPGAEPGAGERAASAPGAAGSAASAPGAGDATRNLRPLAPAVIAALRDAAPRIPAPILLTLAASVRTRTAPLERRVFFPRGVVTRAFATADARAPLPQAVVDEVVAVVHAELLARAQRLPAVGSALLDEQLRDLLVPFHERHAARSLVAVPRGSTLPVPDGDQLRLFVHWTEPPAQRVDLDLSISLYDADWQFKGWCDYTQLSAADGAARHSGDLTSAPAPLGASEFVDLDLVKLRAIGARHVVVVVFSYNDVPFDAMTDAFAGYMTRRDERGEIFDPRTVEQRFDLQGSARIAVPMLIDLDRRRMLWTDLTLPPEHRLHDVGGYRGALARLGSDLHAGFGANTRPTLWEVAALHAAARSTRVTIRRRGGTLVALTRDAGEPVEAFSARVLAGNGAVASAPADDGPAFAALVRADVPLPAGSTLYALYAGETEGVEQLAAADLAAQLAPTSP